MVFSNIYPTKQQQFVIFMEIKQFPQFSFLKEPKKKKKKEKKENV